MVIPSLHLVSSEELTEVAYTGTHRVRHICGQPWIIFGVHLHFVLYRTARANYKSHWNSRLGMDRQ